MEPAQRGLATEDSGGSREHGSLGARGFPRKVEPVRQSVLSTLKYGICGRSCGIVSLLVQIWAPSRHRRTSEVWRDGAQICTRRLKFPQERPQMPAVERSPWGSDWVDLMNQYSYREKSQFDPLDLSQSPGERFRRQRPVEDSLRLTAHQAARRCSSAAARGRGTCCDTER